MHVAYYDHELETPSVRQVVVALLSVQSIRHINKQKTCQHTL